MSKLSKAVRSIHWGRIAAGVGVICSSGAVAAVAPQYAPIAAGVGALINLAIEPRKTPPEAPAGGAK